MITHEDLQAEGWACYDGEYVIETPITYTGDIPDWILYPMDETAIIKRKKNGEYNFEARTVYNGKIPNREALVLLMDWLEIKEKI